MERPLEGACSFLDRGTPKLPRLRGLPAAAAWIEPPAELREDRFAHAAPPPIPQQYSRRALADLEAAAVVGSRVGSTAVRPTRGPHGPDTTARRTTDVSRSFQRQPGSLTFPRHKALTLTSSVRKSPLNCNLILRGATSGARGVAVHDDRRTTGSNFHGTSPGFTASHPGLWSRGMNDMTSFLAVTAAIFATITALLVLMSHLESNQADQDRDKGPST